MGWADRTPVERAALRYCAPHGIPLSVFLGRVIYPGDQQWLEDDTQAAFDWMVYDASRCPGCGNDREEALAKENSFGYRVEVLWCHGCRAIHRADVRFANEAGQKAQESPLAGAVHRFTHTPGDDGGDIELAS